MRLIYSFLLLLFFGVHLSGAFENDVSIELDIQIVDASEPIGMVVFESDSYRQLRLAPYLISAALIVGLVLALLKYKSRKPAIFDKFI